MPVDLQKEIATFTGADVNTLYLFLLEFDCLLGYGPGGGTNSTLDEWLDRLKEVFKDD
jgi:hypothetical protein